MEPKNGIGSSEPHLGEMDRLNVFDSFPRDQDREIENNYTRALVISLLHLARAGHLGSWLRTLIDSQPLAADALKKRVESVVAAMDAIGHDVEAGLVRWPKDCDAEVPRVLIGVRGSQLRDNRWTWGERTTEGDGAFPDAWIGLPDHGLIVLEAKKEGCLDAPQIGRQTTWMNLRPLEPGLPSTLVSDPPEGKARAARRWQGALADRVLDVGWDAAIDALIVARKAVADPVCGWVLDQALAWFDQEGLGGVGSLDQVVRRVRRARNAYLRDKDSALFHRWRVRVRSDLVDLAKRVAVSKALTLDEGRVRTDAPGNVGSRAHAGNDSGDAHVRWAIKGSRARLALFADLTGTGPELGVSVYEEASGCVWQDDENRWMRQRTKHEVECRDKWASLWTERCAAVLQSDVPTDLSVEIAAVKFRGGRKSWQGGSQYDAETGSLNLRLHEFEARLAQGDEKFEGFWKYPEQRVGVRKPAVSLRLSGDVPKDGTLQESLDWLAKRVGELTNVWLRMEKRAK